jgi:glutamate-5-semialdehyde dehydrogenase
MNTHSLNISTYIQQLGRDAQQASRTLALAATAQKNAALAATITALTTNEATILAANSEDMVTAKTNRATAAFLDRLLLTPARIASMCKGLQEIIEQPDPIGDVLDTWSRPNGLHLQQIRVPLGVIGIIYESRPNVTIDAAALCLKSGNAAILRCGSESLKTSERLLNCFQAGLTAANLPITAVQLVTTRDRDAVTAMLQAVGLIDVIIPRGGRGLVERVLKDAKVPIIKHLDGNCHVYLDAQADTTKALNVTLNAKLRRTGVCGAAETVLIHQAALNTIGAPVLKALLDKGCAVRGDAEIQALDSRITPATAADWSTEYLDAIIAAKVVQSTQEAIDHINNFGSHHTDCIITENTVTADAFLKAVDSGIVMVNTSTQFADGGEFGFGAEIGISTDKFHARGPVGAKHLTSTKYCVKSDGAIRA